MTETPIAVEQREAVAVTQRARDAAAELILLMHGDKEKQWAEAVRSGAWQSGIAGLFARFEAETIATLRQDDAVRAGGDYDTHQAVRGAICMVMYEHNGWPHPVELAHGANDELWGLSEALAKAAIVATPADGKAAEGRDVIEAEMLGEIMQDAWGEICDDTDAHPLDISRHKGSTWYSPRHWTDLIALRLNERLAAEAIDALPAAQPSPVEAVDAVRSLESAPKDGSHYLLVGDNFDGGMAVVSWDPDWRDDGWWMLDDGKNTEIPVRGDSKLKGWLPLPALNPSAGEGEA